jgi:hypothetical protein
MKELIISGGSDDLIEIGGCVSEEFGAYEGAQELLGEVIDLQVAGKSVACVHCFYDGCWFFGFVGTDDTEDGDRVTMPEGWRVEVKACGDREGGIAPYSMSLHIFLPDDCDISVVQRRVG